MTDIHDTADLVSKALRRAWQLGQTYWQQADSEYQSHWKKADATQATFNQLVEDTRAVILADNSGAQPVPGEPVVTPKMEQAFYEKVEITTVGSIRGLADGIKAAMLAATPEAKP